MENKNGKKGTLLLSFDYELQKGADASRFGKGNWGREDYEATELLLREMGKRGIRSTFYCLGFAAQEKENKDKQKYYAPEQIREMHLQGHEVGSHGFEHRPIAEMNYDELAGDLRKSKKALEQCIGTEVVSFAPPWNLPRASMLSGVFHEPALLLSPGSLGIEPLLRALDETGYRTVRLYKKSLAEHAEKITGTKKGFVHEPEMKNGLLRINLSAEDLLNCGPEKLLKEAAENAKVCALATHPHSVLEKGEKDKSKINQRFLDFLDKVQEMQKGGRLETRTARELLLAGQTGRN